MRTGNFSVHSPVREKKMNVTIDRLGQGDIERAYENCSLFWDMGTSREKLASYLMDPNCILVVAEVNGEPIGQIMGYILKRWDSKNNSLFLYSIDVVESHRRKGVARGLIQEFRHIGESAGCAGSFVFTNESNIPAMQLYQTMDGKRTNSDDVMFEWK
jgi:ribosomal protein S18 acetylase RimI-like enzyme